MNKLKQTLVFFSFLHLAHSASSGNVAVCDAHANFGCTIWEENDRLRCIDPNAGIMDWVKAPERTDVFTVTMENGESTYTGGGEFLTLTVTVHDKDMKYRGILLHAVDEAGNSVGEMVFPPAEGDNLYHSPHAYCPHAALHADAEPKPYITKFRFKSPPVGTGKITFRCLIKVGPANKGEFYLPNKSLGDISLTEIASTLDDYSVQWYRSERGESCGHTCMKLNKACVEEELQSVTSPSRMESTIGRKYLGDCLLPFLGDIRGAGVSPTSSVDDSKCYFATSADGVAPSCLTKGDSISNGHRFCPCVTNGKRPGRRRTEEEELYDSIETSPANRLNASSSLAKYVVLLVTIVLMLGGDIGVGIGVDGHNWMHSRARATFEASTTKPCRGRKSTDTHAQISGDQTFSYKWATGHSSPSIVAVLRGDYESFLHRTDLEDMLQQYVDEAPQNLAGQAKYKKYHGTKRDCHAQESDCAFYNEEIAKADGLYKREVTDKNSAEFKSRDHPDAPMANLWEYKNAITDRDSFASYHSDKFPWIDSAGFFDHNVHLPADFDVINLGISGRSGPGHYVAWWRWRGYNDCADVDYFLENHPSAPIDHIYGVVEENAQAVYSRLDHCQYIAPKDTVTPCKIVKNNKQGVKECIDELESRANNNAKKKRLGINVVPIKNYQDKVAFDHVNIPIDNPICLDSDNSAYANAKSREKPFDVDAWEHTATDNKVCSSVLWTEELTWKAAILKCTDAECMGMSAFNATKPTNSISATTVFKGCRTTATSNNGDWKTFMKPANLNEATYSTNPNSEIVVNFQRSNAPVNETITQTQLIDSGETFGPKSNGYSYGWSCNTASKMRNDANFQYLQQFNDPCDDGDQRIWEMEVENGLYEITLEFRRQSKRPVETRGCSVENVEIASNRVRQNTPFAKSKVVSVNDGKLTFEGGPAADLKCTFVDLMRVNRVTNADDFPDAWFPPLDHPWGEYEVNGAVGTVVIKLPGAEQPDNQRDDCRSWFFYRGNKNCNGNRESGNFRYVNNNDEGAIVSLADEPCDSVNGCGPVVKKKCKVVEAVSNCGYNVNDGTNRRNELCPITVDCGGMSAKFVRIELPGTARIYDVSQVVIGRTRLAPTQEERQGDFLGVPGEEMLACYGVEARLQTDTTPEYVISEDMTDPIFYSTCYVRENKRTFVPVEETEVPKARYNFHGSCVSCDSFKENKNKTRDELGMVPTWKLAEGGLCGDCELTEMMEGGGGGINGAVWE